MEHRLLPIEKVPYFSTPFIYFAHCSCGEYHSGKQYSELDAQKAWLNHHTAKTQNEGRDEGQGTH